MNDITENEIEHAYWDFDGAKQGYGKYAGYQRSERDAFKWAVRRLLAGQQKEKPRQPKLPKPMAFTVLMTAIKEQK